MEEPLKPVAPPPGPGTVAPEVPAMEAEPPFEGAFMTSQGEQVNVAAGGPFAEAMKLVGRKASPLAIEASAEAVARQSEILSKLGHAGPPPKYAININMDRLSDPRNINPLIEAVAEQIRGPAEQARRGTRSHEVTLEAARERFRDEEGFIFNWRQGEGASAEQVTATRFVLASLRDKTDALAREVVKGAGVEQQLAFRRSLAQMAAVQLQLHGMAAEAGRALSAFRMEAQPGVMDLAEGKVPPGQEVAAAEQGLTAAPQQTAAGPQAAQEGAGEAQPAGAGEGAAQPELSPRAQAAAARDAEALVGVHGHGKGIVGLAEAYLMLPTPAAKNSLARNSTRRGVLDMLGELWFNFVLSGPATQVVNMTGNALTMANSTAERQVAAFWGKLFGMAGREQGVQMGEASAMIQGYWGALGDAWRLANFALRHGEAAGEKTNYSMPLSLMEIWRMSQHEAREMAGGANPMTGSKISTGKEPAITGENVLNLLPDAANTVSQRMIGRNVMNPAELGKGGAFGRMTDFLSLMIDAAGGVLRTPTRAMGAADQFAKTLAYRGELRARAVREADASGLTGDARQEFIDHQINFLLPETRLDAEQFAREMTMSEELISNFGKRLQQAGSSRLGFLFMPFIRVTTNITDYATQRVLFPARPRWWSELTSGDPAVRDLAMAKASTGALVWMSAMGAASTMYDADEDAPVVVTGAGPADPSLKAIWRQRGYMEYAVRVGGKDGTWYSYNRLDPGGQILGIAADTVNIMFNLDEAEREEMGAALIAAVGNNLVRKNYMSSIAEAMEVFTSFDPNAYQRWARSKATSFMVPNALAQIANEQDPYLRRVVSIGDDLAKKRSGSSRAQLPMVRDLAGYPVKQEWVLGTRFTGFAEKDQKVDPVADEIWRLEMPFSKPRNTIRGVELTEHQYDRFQLLAGHGLKAPAGQELVMPPVFTGEDAQEFVLDVGGLGMWEALGKLIKSAEYKKLAEVSDMENQKTVAIKRVRDWYRGAAERRMLAEYPDLTEQVLARDDDRRRARGLPDSAVEQAAQGGRTTLMRAIDIAKDYEVTP